MIPSHASTAGRSEPRRIVYLQLARGRFNLTLAEGIEFGYAASRGVAMSMVRRTFGNDAVVIERAPA